MNTDSNFVEDQRLTLDEVLSLARAKLILSLVAFGLGYYGIIFFYPPVVLQQAQLFNPLNAGKLNIFDLTLRSRSKIDHFPDVKKMLGNLVFCGKRGVFGLFYSN